MDEEERRVIAISPYFTEDHLETLRRLAERIQESERLQAAAPPPDAQIPGPSPSILAQLGQFANDQPVMLIGAFAYGVIVGLAIAQHRGG